MRMCLCASACGMCAVFVRERWVAWGHGGEAMEGVRKIYNAPTLCIPIRHQPLPLSCPRRPVDMPATPLYSHVGCRLLGTPARLSVRVAAEVVVVAMEFLREVEGN